MTASRAGRLSETFGKLPVNVETSVVRNDRIREEVASPDDPRHLQSFEVFTVS